MAQKEEQEKKNENCLVREILIYMCMFHCVPRTSEHATQKQRMGPLWGRGFSYTNYNPGTCITH